MTPYDWMDHPGWDDWDDSEEYVPTEDEVEYLSALNRQAHEYQEPARCSDCEYLFAVIDGRCQYCEEKLVSLGIPAIYAGFESLLTNHLAFARWCEENEPRLAHA